MPRIAGSTYKRKTASRKRTAAPRKYFGKKSKTVYTRRPRDSALNNYKAMVSRPFDDYTQASALPDQFGGNSVNMKLMNSVILTTDANGAAALQVLPRLDNFYRISNAITADVPAYPGSFVPCPQYVPFADAIQSWRPLVLATRTTYIGQHQLRSGIVSSAISTDTLDETTTPITSWGAENSGNTHSQAIGTDSLVSISKLFDRPSFLSPNTTNFDKFLSNIQVGFSGLPPSSACVKVDLCMFVEVVAKVGSSLGHAERPSGTSINFRTTDPSHHESQSNTTPRKRPRATY